MIIALPAKSLLRLVPFVSKDEERYYLNGVCIQTHPKSGLWLVGTDGHRLGVWQEPDFLLDGQLPLEGIILAVNKDTLALLKRKPSKDQTAYAVINTDAKTLSYAEATSLGDGFPPRLALQEGALVDGTFPNWRGIIPKHDNLKAFDYGNESGGFNPRYMAEFQKVCFKGELGGMMILCDKENDGTGPAIVLLSSLPQFVGVIMPMRGDIESNIKNMNTVLATAA